MEDILEREYPELIGKIVSWRNGIHKHRGEVVGCDFHIGITIVNADNHKDYLTCVYGPLSLKQKERIAAGGTFDDEGYKRRFKMRVESIKAGKYDCDDFAISKNGVILGSINPSASACPFGQ